MKELDYRLACHEFGSAYEVFQKTLVEQLLTERNVPTESIAALMDTRLDRLDYAKLLASLLAVKEVKIPAATARNLSYHRGKVPPESEVCQLAESVLLRMDETMRLFVGAYMDEVQKARDELKRGGLLPNMRDATRTKYDFFAGVEDLKGYWAERRYVGEP